MSLTKRKKALLSMISAIQDESILLKLEEYLVTLNSDKLAAVKPLTQTVFDNMSNNPPEVEIHE